ncbi:MULTISPECIES: 2-dehydro-3-deoxy-6-phosphogalactonate aldolase [Aminobacter]|jgi:2-dehydro-3-deoxyphosphogalactonate aldolase|uniref:2-dehydro-3-deoxyphosphogalactonate aldolase n=1 Tax=Aminobacter ciceronei TaxID=150723 RepID=A0ABR6C7Z3_9HYPH|nr:MULTISPECIES: 2-dehydro-3-deoxy-6-phosphogalactonate aldolase [Aminobacter]MBA8907366.1 2-dehydro-3-deoxyphosphogalactonate aldolase [Aminobacter ciceronei]MBA9021139.1 2-dehydro-3-deoxyphosphogalactonate aldolase [Aminobacter ciceronei]MRX33749.1 2-dehydro-3-deoxy-6-phosphogalactonate aldolase [Aminobacter sp. MDW-2]QNH35139.1 2-dehydro-3-deoxy-6-phosphogalactonate aldolase [Aminobacter sp. MDW-2]
MSVTAPFPELGRGLVAILRGLKPEEALGVGQAVFDAGIEAIEVPLNSPDPFRSIEILARALPAALVGGGTVVWAKDVDRLHDAGGRLLVSPNIDAEVMGRAGAHKMVTMPGVMTPTDAFLALRLGASALKFFPASVLGPGGISAIRAVLPRETQVGVVGGVSEVDFAAYAKVGVQLFGLGSSLYKPGMSAADVGERARAAVAGWDAIGKGA